MLLAVPRPGLWVRTPSPLSPSHPPLPRSGFPLAPHTPQRVWAVPSQSCPQHFLHLLCDAMAQTTLQSDAVAPHGTSGIGLWLCSIPSIRQLGSAATPSPFPGKHLARAGCTPAVPGTAFGRCRAVWQALLLLGL